MAHPVLPLFRRRRTLAGFTLIELLIVIIIVGILMAIGVPAYLQYQQKAKDTDAKAALTTAYKAAVAGDTEVNTGKFPVASTIVSDIVKDEPGLSVARGSCTTAGAATPKQVLVDPSSTSNRLVICTQSASGTIWQLTGPLTGTPTITDGTQVPLSFSGGEITEAVRTAALSGDGLSSDSSTGVWVASTNLLPNTSFENDTSGWVASNVSGDAAIAQSTAHAMFGTHSVKLTASTGTIDSVRTTGFNYAPSTTYTLSGWFYIETLGPGVTAIYLTGVYNSPQSSAVANLNLGKVGQWQYVKTTFTTDANPQTGTYVDAPRISGTLTGTTVVYADGVQLEAQPAATPYIATNGSTASRVVGDVQAPSSMLNATQGWVAVRARLDQGLPVPQTNYWPGLFDWGENNIDSLEMYLSPGQSIATMRRIQGGVASGAGWNASVATSSLSKPAGSYITLIGTWTASQVAISADGASFTTQNNATIPTIAATNLDIGRRLASEALNGDIMWFACGTGTLSNADAATINSWGNADPKRSQFPSSAQATMVWDGTSANGSLK